MLQRHILINQSESPYNSHNHITTSLIINAKLWPDWSGPRLFVKYVKIRRNWNDKPKVTIFKLFTAKLAIVVADWITKTIKKTFNFTLLPTLNYLFKNLAHFAYCTTHRKTMTLIIYVKFNVFLPNHQTNCSIDLFFYFFL